MKCPKCGFEQADSANECVRCGLVFHKFEAIQRKKEQLQARYSPQSGDNAAAAALAEPAAEAPPAAAPEAPAITLEHARELRKQFEKLFAGVQGVLKFQTTLGDELTAQRAALRELAAQFGNLQAAVEEQVTPLQARMQELDARLASLREEVQLNRHPDDVGESLRAIGTGLDELLRLQADGRGAAEINRRLDQLEKLQAQIRSAMETAPARADGDWAAQETLLIKSELQALRAEVRTLMDLPAALAPVEAAPAAPAADTGALERELGLRLQETEQRLAADGAALDARLQEIEARVTADAAGGSALDERLQRLEERIAADAAAVEQKLAAAQGAAGPIRDKLQELEAKQAKLADLEAGRKDLAVELQSLKKAYQHFAKESRTDLDKQAGALEKYAKDLDGLKTQVTQVRDTLDRLRKVFAKS